MIVYSLGGEFTKTLRKVCTCQKLKFSFLLLEYCKIRECYAVVNAFTIRNMSSLFLYMKCNSRSDRAHCECMRRFASFGTIHVIHCIITNCACLSGNKFTNLSPITFLYMKCNSRKINLPTKNMTKIVTLLHF
jgi:hypothetical protein